MDNTKLQKFMECLDTLEFKNEEGVLQKSGLLEYISMEEDITYGCTNGRKLVADIYYREKKAQSLRPAIVFVHGGGFKAGNRKQFLRHAAYLAFKYNIFSIAISYRFSQEAIFPAALQDTKCAVRWLRSVAEEYNIDAQRIAIAGGSAGGHLSAMTAATRGVPEYEGNGGNQEFSSHVSCAVLLNAVYVFTNIDSENKIALDAIELFLGGTVKEMPQRYIEASPLYRIDKNTAPMLLLHGNMDVGVPYQTAVEAYNKLSALGGSS
jgi:acetyl esterase/lipase